MTAFALAESDTGIPTLYWNGQVRLEELCAAIFGSMPRSDQRRIGEMYVRGLLGAEGRKSIRRLASLPGVDANEQRLHHFINNSSWDWTPVRRALTEYVMGRVLPHAWVVHPIAAQAPRRAGVVRHVGGLSGPAPGPYEAVGVWAASEQANIPVSWRHPVPVHQVRGGPGVREGQGQLADHLAEAALEPVRDWRLPAVPVIADARRVDPGRLISRLRTQGVRALVRIEDSLTLCGADPALRGGLGLVTTAGALAGLFKNLRRPVAWLPEGPSGTPRTSLVSACRVRVREYAGRGLGGVPEGDLVLLSITDHHPRSAQLWLTDMTGAQVEPLVRLTSLLDHVARDGERIGSRLGLRDFSGRSADGWHRHATLVSAAYALTMLNQPAAGGRGDARRTRGNRSVLRDQV